MRLRYILMVVAFAPIMTFAGGGDYMLRSGDPKVVANAETVVTEIPTSEPTEVTVQENANLGKFEYKKVAVEGKSRKKWRYVSGDTVMTSAEFEQYCKTNCPEAYKYIRKSRNFALVGLATCWTVILPWPFIIVSAVNADKALPAYNESCAGK